MMLTGCMMSEQEKFIQGTWSFSDDLPSENPDDKPMSFYLKWTFDNGQFSVDGYPPLQQSGNYSVLENQNDSLKLLMTDQQGDWGTENSNCIIVINILKNTLLIKGAGPYKKTADK